VPIGLRTPLENAFPPAASDAPHRRIQKRTGMQQSTPMKRFKVTLHGFGEYAVVFYHLIKHAQSSGSPLDFSIILPTSHYLKLLQEVLPDEKILNLEDEVLKLRDDIPMDALAQYNGNIHVDIDAEKLTFKHRRGDDQMRLALKVYTAYRTFLERERPDHAAFNHIEGYEQKMAAALCGELGIPISVPVDCRTISGSVMCPDAHETLPEPTTDISVNMERARALVMSYRERHSSAFVPPLPPGERGASLPRMIRPFKTRLADFIRRSLKDPSRFEPDFLKAALMNNLPRYRDWWYEMRRKRARRWHDLKSLDELPEKFVYYPLHFSPESSINTPAPYYIDQMRAVDAIRHAMPSNYTLIVKDHPAALLIRKKGLMDKMRRSSGVRVIHSSLSGRELIQRAALTISVTGTSTLEAFLLGKPSLTLGNMFASKFLGGVTPLLGLDERIRHVIANPPTDDYVIRSVAEIMTISRPFSVFGLGMEGDPVFTEKNIANMLAAVEDSVHARHRQPVAMDAAA
jgi:hypothetical protein